MRPTSSAVLAMLGQFAEAHADLASQHSYLSEAAMDLIREYQAGPLPAGGALPGEDREDTTSPSHSDLPASYRPRPRPRPRESRAGRRGAAGLGPRWAPPRLRRWLGAHLAFLGWGAAAAALVAVGVIIGASLTGSAPRPAQSSALPGGPPPGGPPPAPATVCGTAAAKPGSGPALCMVGQSQGQADAAFVVRGTGFDPGTAVTVTLTGVGIENNPILDTTSRVKPVVGPDGTFSFAISRVYRGSLQLGEYAVNVRDAGRRASTEFMVIPPAP
jgi:hypothetical protein